MSKDLIQKNLKLSLEFDRYIVENPAVLKGLSRGTEVVITSARDRKLSEENLRMALSGSGKFVEVRKEGKSWKIKKFSPVQK
jgi:hypothetical protein